MHSVIRMIAIGCLFAAIGLAVPAAAAGHHAATPAAAQRLRCPAHLRDHGTSLSGLSGKTKVPVAIILWFSFRCSGYHGGGWTARMARYLNAGNLRAHYYGWYWIGALQ